MAADADHERDAYEAQIQARERQFELYVRCVLGVLLAIMIGALAAMAATGWDLDTRRTVVVGFSFGSALIGGGTVLLGMRATRR